jgi:hypothetical protein
MNLEEFEVEAKAKLAVVETWAENLWNALPPEFQHPALDAAKAGVADLGALATTEVNKVVPPTADAMVDTAIASLDAKAESDIAAIQNKTAAAKAALAALKVNS